MSATLEASELAAHEGQAGVLWDGRYRIVRTLGEGGMGRVLLAHDLTANNRAVALKILLPSFFDTLSEFLHEYVIQRGLSHPHVPRAYELGFAHEPDATYPYFAMEYCRGVPLMSAVRRGAPLRLVFDAMAGLLRALDHIHRQGLVHGDVKPNNILVSVTSPGDDGPARDRVGEGAPAPGPERAAAAGDGGDEAFSWLIDLGVAAPFGGYTDSEIFVGTPEYASPELLTGVGVDGRADLYAAGLILFELLERRRPWPDSDETRLLVARRTTQAPPITAPGCPPALAALVARMLDPDLARRPPTAAAVLAELEAAMGFEAEIEPPAAFARRLMVLPHPAEAEVRGAAAALLAGLTPAEVEPELVGIVLEGRPEQDGRRLAQQLGDRASLLGARVLRVNLGGLAQTPLSALQEPLGVLLRLHAALAPGYAQAPGPAAAARVLDGSGRSLVLVVDGLEHADPQSLAAIHAALTREGGRVRLVATLRPSDAPAAPELERLLGERRLARHRLAALGPEALAAWLDQAVGPESLRPADRDALLESARGTALGLIRGLGDFFRRGRLTRTPQGYRPGAVDPAAAPPTLAPVEPRGRRAPTSPPADPHAPLDELDALLACIHASLPEKALQRYLAEHASATPALIARGALVQREDGTLRVGDEARRAAHYARVPLARRRQLHRRLAVALEESRSRDHERMAFEYQRSETPLLAVPHLVTAARRAPADGRASRARRLLDAAESLLRDHGEGHSDLELWRFWSLLWRADAHVSLATGDLERFEEVVDRLFRLGTDMAHRQTLQAALEFRLLVAERRRDWNRLVEDAGALLGLDPDGPTPDGLARMRWAKALRYRADGLPAQAAEQLQRALDARDALSPDTLLAILGARAALFVDLSWHVEASAAIRDYLDAATSARRQADVARARALGASLQRHRGSPGAALAEVRQLLRELEGERVPGVDSLIAWELASCHLEFGWFGSARDHARQAEALACEGHDDAQRVRALLVEAAALRALGQRDPAWARAWEASRLIADDDVSASVNARLLALELALDVGGFRQLEDVAREAAEIAWRAQRRGEGARAARAFGLAAQAAVRRKDPALAQQWATLALKALDRYAPGHVHRPRHLATLADAQLLARADGLAKVTRETARTELERIAAGIDDPELRQAWLDHPLHRVLGVTPLPDAAPPRRSRRVPGRRRSSAVAVDLSALPERPEGDDDPQL